MFLSLHRPKHKTMEYLILHSNNPNELSKEVTSYIREGWKPIGSHQVVETHRQNRFSGNQHKDTVIEVEYSQTIVKE